MEEKNRRKGFILAFIATLALASVYIFSKSALNKVHLFQFGFYWFLLALILNLIFVKITGKKINYKKYSKKERFAILTNAIFETLGTILFFSAINFSDNPAVISFLVNLGPVFTLILAYFFLKERFRIGEYFGITITLLGVLIINYSPESSFHELFSKATGYIVFASLFYAIAVIIAKRNIQKIEPVVLSISRTIMLMFVSFFFMLHEGLSFKIGFDALLYIAGGAFMGPFLAILTSYYSFKYIEVSLTNIIMSTKSVLVVISSYLILDTVMHGNQLVGGAFTIAGIITISMVKRKKN
jgi:drug/metabolite transporter (DMT)-like permease